MTYEQYCNMTWAEFQIRLFSFNRMQKNEWEKVNFLSNTIIEVAPYMKPIEKRKMIKHNYNMLFEGGVKKKVSLNDLQRKAILKAQEEFKKNRK